MQPVLASHESTVQALLSSQPAAQGFPPPVPPPEPLPVPPPAPPPPSHPPSGGESPHWQGSKLEPSGLQTWPPVHPAGPMQASDLPGVQTDVAGPLHRAREISTAKYKALAALFDMDFLLATPNPEATSVRHM